MALVDSRCAPILAWYFPGVSLTMLYFQVYLNPEEDKGVGKSAAV